MSESLPPEHWTEIDVEPPAEFPERVTEDDGPFAWENENTGRRIWLEPNDELKDFEAWLVTGENSVVTSGESIDAAQAAARRFMESNTHPSGMV